MRLKHLFPLLLAACALPGCLFANITTPLDTDMDNTKVTTKTGESTWRGFLWLVAIGDAGTQAAAKDGGLKVIHNADQKILNVLFGLYYQETTLVYGE